ncbi:MAG: winged helix-turn-helix domain-containing protein [Planctomycetaceae bacterium]|nr:winged helix-turn-helix domain-containing protein [Planctomycetaceae bacterium]
MSKHKILVVEDDRSLADIVRYNLQQAGYEVFWAFDGPDGLTQAQLHSPDLIVLDLMLPGIDGLEVCRRLRSSPQTKDVLILMLTAKGEEADHLIGFSVGCDDYVVKPYSVKILLERIKALIRRRERQSLSVETLTGGGVTIDRRKHSVTLQGSPLDLTPSEFRLLETLMRQSGRAFDRSELIDSALGADTLVLERTIDVHIRSLRKKLGESAELIQTVRGIGYRFREDPNDGYAD